MAETYQTREGPEPRIAVEALRLSNLDAPTLAHVVAGAEFTHRRLPGGKSDIKWLQCALPNSVINRGIYSPAVLVHGLFARNAITVGTMLHQTQNTLLNGIELESGNAQFHSENAEMCYRGWPQATWITFVLTRHTFLQYCADHFDQLPELPPSGIAHFKANSKAEALELISIMKDLDASLRLISAGGTAPRLAEAVEQDMLARWGSMLCSRPVTCKKDDRTRIRKCREMLRKAMELVDHDPTETLDLQTISRATGLTPRTLQRTFQSTCGICPHEWFRIERLNRVRNELRRNPKPGSVTRTATRWGFFHFGRFAQYYRQLFGERPVDTLRNANRPRLLSPPTKPTTYPI